MITLAPSKTVANAYSLNWGAQQSHILDGLRDLIGRDDDLMLTDVTLACDGDYIPAHKLVLSLCSSFFKDLFKKNRADKSNTIVIVSHVNARNLKNLLKFMYQGKVDIPSKDVDSFLQAGNLLKVEGLIGNVGDSQGQRSTTPTSTQRKPGPASKKPASTSNASGQIKRARLNDNESTKADGKPPTDKTATEPTGNDDDPLGNSDAADDDEDEGDEEGVDFDNVKTEPIEVYSGYEEGNQSEFMDEGNDDTYEGSGEDSNLNASSSSAVPGPSTSSQANRPRGSLPVILDGEYFRVVSSDADGRVKAKCISCGRRFSKEVLISGNFSSTSNFVTHLKRKHQTEFKKYVATRPPFIRKRVKMSFPEKSNQKGPSHPIPRSTNENELS